MYIGTLEPASNRATFTRVFEVIDDETDEPIDITATTIVFTITDPLCREPTLTATIGDGITITDTSKFAVFFSRTDMTGLCPKTYDIGCTVAQADTEQFIIGTIAILDGVVPR